MARVISSSNEAAAKHNAALSLTVTVECTTWNTEILYHIAGASGKAIRFCTMLFPYVKGAGCSSEYLYN